MNNGYTAIQKKMMLLLSDGMPHSREELHSCLRDELGELLNIYTHISELRKKLRPKGQDIVRSGWKESSRYQLIRLMPSAYDGRK